MNTCLNRIRTIALALCAACVALSASAADKLKVVATLPDLADIVREIGGERVDVSTIARGTENLHHVQTRPSHLVAMNKADLFVQIGLSLETAFVPGLLEASRNPRIQPGQPGFVNTSAGWQALDVPGALDRKNGDVHPQGNPHMNLDPRGGRQMADAILAGLVAVDPGSKAEYEKRHAAYTAKLDEARARWAELGKAWKGRKIVVYHKEYDYLAATYGLEIVGSIESNPGIPPTPNSLAELIAKMKQASDVVILTATWSNNRDVSEVASRANAKVVELPNQCGGGAGTESWIAMMDTLHKRLAEAFGGAPVAR